MKENKMNFKENLVESGGLKDKVFYYKDSGFYCNNCHDNFFSLLEFKKHKKYFENGEGQELKEKKNGEPPKMTAVHSSAAFAVNFWGWIDKDHTFVYNNIEYDSVVFEEEFRCLKSYYSEKSKKYSYPRRNSSMDVVLVSKDEKHILLIESKFTETFSSSNEKLKEMGKNSYSYKDCYYSEGDKWKELINYFIKESETKKTKTYYDGIKQNICHLLGITNLKQGDTKKWYEETIRRGENKPELRSWLLQNGIDITNGNFDFTYMNVIFMPSRKDFEIENDKVSQYQDLFEDFRTRVKDYGLLCKGVEIEKCTTYSQIWKDANAIKNMPVDRKDYLLKRYMCLSDIED